jgi:hypothetical protein
MTTRTPDLREPHHHPDSRDAEIELVVWTIQSLADEHPAKKRLQGIWERASLSGWLRGDLIGATAESEWAWAVTFCERAKLVSTLLELGPKELLKELRDNRPTGTIRTPDSLAYDLRFAHQTPSDEGGRRIVLATDRPIGFWEAAHQPRTIDYPFTVIQMEIGRDGHGKGTMSYATKITARNKNTIELENYSTSPVMLTDIQARH